MQLSTAKICRSNSQWSGSWPSAAGDFPRSHRSVPAPQFIMMFRALVFSNSTTENLGCLWPGSAAAPQLVVFLLTALHSLSWLCAKEKGLSFRYTQASEHRRNKKKRKSLAHALWVCSKNTPRPHPLQGGNNTSDDAEGGRENIRPGDYNCSLGTRTKNGLILPGTPSSSSYAVFSYSKIFHARDD